MPETLRIKQPSIINWCRTNSWLLYSDFKLYRAISEDSSLLGCDVVCCKVNSSHHFTESSNCLLSESSSIDGLDSMTAQMKELCSFETPGTAAERRGIFQEHLNLPQEYSENLIFLYISLVPTNPLLV
jgi:hypothetical protein